MAEVATGIEIPLIGLTEGPTKVKKMNKLRSRGSHACMIISIAMSLPRQ